MVSIASKFSDTKTKFQVAVAATAVASTAAFAPVIAQAAPTMPSPLAPISALASSDIALSPFQFVDAPLDSTWGGWLWLGYNRTPDNGGPAYADVIVFTPLSLVPGFLKPLYKALTGWINIQACVFGVSLRIGPYGRTSVTVGRGC